jgi:hypothetical protein
LWNLPREDEISEHPPVVVARGHGADEHRQRRVEELPQVIDHQETVDGCHDQADAEWIVIRGPVRGHDDTPFGQPTPGQPIGHAEVGPIQGVFGVLSYY